MRAEIYDMANLSEDMGGSENGPCLGVIVWINGQVELEVQDKSLRKAIEEITRKPIEARGGGKDGNVHASFSKHVTKEDPQYLHFLKDRLRAGVKVGDRVLYLWLIIQD